MKYLRVQRDQLSRRIFCLNLFYSITVRLLNHIMYMQIHSHPKQLSIGTNIVLRGVVPATRIAVDSHCSKRIFKLINYIYIVLYYVYLIDRRM